MRVGTLCYATDQGLGILAKSFYDRGIVTHPIVVRHGRHPEHDEWYPGAPRISDLHGQLAYIKDYCCAVDVMLFFETPFVWSLTDHCRNIGVKTALMVMHECLHEAVWTHQPDIFLCPSDLDTQCVASRCYTDCVKRINVPVEVPHRVRLRAETFVHNAGHGGLKGRNGTAELLMAMTYVKSPIKLVIRSQAPLNFPDVDPRIVKVHYGTMKYEDLWRDGGEGDVFIFPEKFNGLSLPLQEAHAAGMLVMATNRFPMNTWLPTEPLIPTRGTRISRIGAAYTAFDESVVDPKDIAATIDAWYGKDISHQSLQGQDRWAKANSWSVLGPKYKTILEELCSSAR